MKKFLAFLTFLTFLIISQMQSVHAFDMSGMDMSSGHHSRAGTAVSIFCETSPDTTQNQCAKELIPDKALSKQDTPESLKTPIISVPFSHYVEVGSQENTSKIVSICGPPEAIYYRSAYVNMMGIMKSLN